MMTDYGQEDNLSFQATSDAMQQRRCEKHWFPGASARRPEKLELPTLGSEV